MFLDFLIFLGNFKSDKIFRSLRAYSSVWLEHLSYKQKVPSSNLGRLIYYIDLNLLNFVASYYNL